MNYREYMEKMTLSEVEEVAKNLRLNFLEKDVNIVFEAGRPRIVVD